MQNLPVIQQQCICLLEMKIDKFANNVDPGEMAQNDYHVCPLVFQF